MTQQVLALNPADSAQIASCYRVYKYLRPHVSEAEFLERVPLQAAEGFHLVYLEEGGEVVAAAGYRILHFLAWGKVLYVDDLITDPEKKRRGYGGALMDWLIAHARSEHCDQLHLDTGFQRLDAHRLYLNKGLHLHCHHMAITLK